MNRIPIILVTSLYHNLLVSTRDSSLIRIEGLCIFGLLA